MYEQASCGGANVACQNAGGTGGESTSYDAAAAGPFFVWVDGAFGAAGSYELVVTPPP